MQKDKEVAEQNSKFQRLEQERRFQEEKERELSHQLKYLRTCSE